MIKHSIVVSNEEKDFLRKVVEAQKIRFESNISAYLEFSMMCDSILEAIASAESVQVKNAESSGAKAIRKPQSVYNLCPVHKTYGGKRAPQSACDRCWEVYTEMVGREFAKKKKQSFERKHKTQVSEAIPTPASPKPIYPSSEKAQATKLPRRGRPAKNRQAKE